MINASDLPQLFRFHDWANARILGAAEALSEVQVTEPLGGSFPSVRDTCAHIVAWEWIWLQRWQGRSPAALPPWSASATCRELREQLEGTDGIQFDRSIFFYSLDDEALRTRVAYTNMAGERWEYPLRDMIFHLVTHSIYHRGQTASKMRQLGAEPPATDLLSFEDQLRAPRQQ
jgi:uncharacterized damage-inducible protein DinB